MELDEQTLIDFVTAQRWFGSKTRHVTHARVIDRATLRDVEPTLEVALVEIGFETGTHETYQLLRSGDDLDAVSDPRNRAYLSLGCLCATLIGIVILVAAVVWVLLFFLQPGWD